MKRWRIALLMLIVVVALSIVFWGCSSTDSDGENLPQKVRRREASVDPVQKVLDSMSLEEKVGQLMVIGFGGSSLTQPEKERIERIRPGGLILFSRNVETPEQLIGLTTELQSNAKVPYFIATDQEGGVINRVTFSGVVMPGAMAMGAADSKELARKVGRATGEQLASLGINMNFAPVLDVNNNPMNPVIGIRSFGEDPELVARLGVEYIKGLQDAGVMSAAKHFPGHGDTSVDSHLDLPKVDFDMDRLSQVELVPFRAAADAGVDAIMSAHIVFRALDKTGRPATLSRPILTGLLRDEIGFDGIVVTDDLEMKAISNNFGAEAGVLAIQAGADLVLVSHTGKTQDAVYDSLLQAVRDRKITEERIDESVRRILRAKHKLGLLDGQKEWDPAKQSERYYEALNSVVRVAQELADRSVTVAFDRTQSLPLPRGTSVLVLSGAGKAPRDPISLGRSLEEYVSELGLGITVRTMTFDASTPVADVKYRASQAGMVVLVTNNVRSGDYQTKVCQALIEVGKPLIVIAASSPYDADYLPEINAYITLYGLTPASVNAAVRVLVGEQEAKGKLPVTLRKYQELTQHS